MEADVAHRSTVRSQVRLGRPVVFMVQCVKLMLRVFEFAFDCFVYRQNVTCLKIFTRYGHDAGEVEDITIGILAVVSSLPKIGACSCCLLTLC